MRVLGKFTEHLSLFLYLAFQCFEFVCAEFSTFWKFPIDVRMVCGEMALEITRFELCQRSLAYQTQWFPIALNKKI